MKAICLALATARIANLRSYHEVEFVEEKEPFYIQQQVERAFSKDTLPTIQIDYITLTPQLKPE